MFDDGNRQLEIRVPKIRQLYYLLIAITLEPNPVQVQTLSFLTN